MKARRIAILPSLCTLGNALCGFAAITFTWRALAATLEPSAALRDEAAALWPRDILIAGYFILLGMIFDALDGRLARFARATSDFGGQLDSVADAVTFGVAPAFLMNRVVVEGLKGPVRDAFGAQFVSVLAVTWICAAVYMACALIRLARFNVENVHDEEAHESFKGLPSPAAAGALVSLVVLLARCWEQHAYPQVAMVLLWLLPVVAVGLGVLMVARVRYVHLVNYVLQGRRTVGHLVRILLGAALGILILLVLGHVVLVLGFGGYVLSGPILGIVRRRRRAAPAFGEAGKEARPTEASTEAPSAANPPSRSGGPRTDED